MSPPRKARDTLISDTAAARVVAVFRDSRPRWQAVSPGRHVAAGWYVSALDTLSSREVDALTVLEGQHIIANTMQEQVRRVTLRRVTRRSALRWRAQLPANDRQVVEEMLARLKKDFGNTRPIAKTAPFETALAQTGFTPTEIDRLLAVLGAAPAKSAGGPKAGGQRVHDRLARAKRRADTYKTAVSGPPRAALREVLRSAPRFNCGFFAQNLLTISSEDSLVE